MIRGSTGLHVAAVILVRPSDSWILLATRPEGKSFSGYWEFPGGKLEVGESLEEAAKRELHEELGLRLKETKLWQSKTVADIQRTTYLHFFISRTWEGEIVARENQQYMWWNPQTPPPTPALATNESIMLAIQQGLCP